jgi:YHS domain-containing protein
VATIFLVLASAAGCGSDDETAPTSRHVRTIDQEHVTHAVDDGTGTAADESTETAVGLPFAPAISMDPVDGSKVSIRASTPSTEHGGKIYHFSSRQNLEAFLESPEKYLSGNLGAY